MCHDNASIFSTTGNKQPHHSLQDLWQNHCILDRHVVTREHACGEMKLAGLAMVVMGPDYDDDDPYID